jgi:3-oxoacyl-[acyl-carrier-protein] synthase-3
MTAAILGTGYSVPSRVITNDNPIFDYLRENQPAGSNLFAGYHERRFLEPGQLVTELMADSSRKALSAAGLGIDKIDRLYGYSTVSVASTPNDLGSLHGLLKMRGDARVIAVNTEFTNFIDALEMANDNIALRRSTYALVTVGCNWSRYVDFRTSPALSAGDGAGSVVMGPATDPGQFRVIDTVALVGDQYFGTMQMAPEAIPSLGQAFTHPYFQILAGGADGFTDFAIPSVTQCVNLLLTRHKLTGGDITLATHQASSVMMDQWQQEIQPRYYASTFKEYANPTLAAVAISFAARYNEIPTDWVVLCGVGHYFHTTAVLLGRHLP